MLLALAPYTSQRYQKNINNVGARFIHQTFLQPIIKSLRPQLISDKTKIHQPIIIGAFKKPHDLVSA